MKNVVLNGHQKRKNTTMESRNDAIWAAFFGCTGGTYAWVEFYMMDASYFVSLMKAVGTAGISTVAGLAVKYAVAWAWKKWKERKKRT